MKKQCMDHKKMSGFFSKALLLVITGIIALITPALGQSSGSVKDQSEQAISKKNLADIIWNGKLEDLKAFVEKDKSVVNLRLDNDETPLTAASYKGDVEMVKYLLAQGAEVESKNKWNNNALQNAAIVGNVEIGKLLIAKGANIETRGSGNYTPLLQALDKNQVEFALMLINKGVDIKAADNAGNSAISIASWYSNPKVLKVLVERGANVNTVNDNYSVLHYACSNGNLESIDYLVQKGANVNMANADGDLPLQMVVIRSNSEAVKLLAKQTKNINQKEKYLGNTVLHQAAINGDISSTQYLLEAGADANITNNHGLKPVDYAAKYGYVNLVEYYGSINPENNKMLTQAKMALASVNEKFSSNGLKVWYTGHSGWALQFKDKVIVIDYWQNGAQNEGTSLANGKINPKELAGKKVYVFVTHDHRDHYDTTIFQWAKSVKDVKYVYGFHPEKTSDNQDQPYHGPSYTYINDNQTGMVDDIKVTTIKANDSGQGFLLEVNGLKIFHSGDHALFNADLEADYKKEIDFVARQTGHIDIAFLPVTGCPSNWKKEHIVQGFFYVLDKLNPREVFPMHAFQREFALKEFAEIAKQKNCGNKLICVDNKGDHYTYNKMVTAGN